jgi:hypothetical protein
MREVFLSNHLQKEANKNLRICLLWAVFTLMLLALGIATGLAFVIIWGTGALVVAGFIVIKHGPTYATYRCGISGERILRNQLRSLNLSDEYTAYYNLSLNGNGKAFDIDCILVGPVGLYVFEVKHHAGLIFYRDGIWAQIKVGRRAHPYAGHLKDPCGQLLRNIRKLKALLGQDDSNALWLPGAIVFTSPRAVLDIDGLRWIKAIPVKSLGHILSKRMILSAQQICSVNSRLSSLSK